eukprot:4451900-Amphidinium_carterae.1
MPLWRRVCKPAEAQLEQATATSGSVQLWVSSTCTGAERGVAVLPRGEKPTDCGIDDHMMVPNTWHKTTKRDT